MTTIDGKKLTFQSNTFDNLKFWAATNNSFFNSDSDK